jgi:hypothetical protein
VNSIVDPQKIIKFGIAKTINYISAEIHVENIAVIKPSEKYSKKALECTFNSDLIVFCLVQFSGLV